MCGIFAVSGVDGAAQVVLAGLKSLEYRGYDSWGIGVVAGDLKLEKYQGKIVVKNSSLPNSTIAFGHTRWATHGGVTVANSHPHRDCAGKIGVVHNGIVENYQELKDRLVKNGHQFSSETDTEVIAHLIEDKLKTLDLNGAVRSVFGDLKGFSAIVVVDSESGKIAAVRRGSPLVVGVGKNKTIYISSDAISLSPHTRSVVYLPDEIVAIISSGEVQFFDMLGKQKILKLETLDQSIVPAVKDKFSHFMLKEIHDQPRVIANAVSNMGTAVSEVAREIEKHESLVMMGCGSALFASMFGSYLLSRLAGRRCQVVPANEFNYLSSWFGKKDYALFVSQSGETMDVMEAHSSSQSKGVMTGALVNVIGSSLSRKADQYIPLTAGPEIGVASTKVIAAMYTAFYLMSAKLVGTTENEINKTIMTAAKAVAETVLPSYVKKHITPLVKRLKSVEHIYVLGKDKYYPVALEAALKLKEITYIHAEGFASGELKHGVIALIDKGTPCIVFVPNDDTKDDVLSAIAEVKARGAYVVGVGPQSHSLFDHYLPTTEAGMLSALPMIATIQQLSYYLALARKLDPDKPRNLAKSVTVK